MLSLKPVSLRAANEFVAALHRNHKPARGCKFCISVVDSDDAVRGVIVVSRPVSRALDDGWTFEAVRCCTDGAPNACSMLYGAAARASKAMGARRVVTYTLQSEGGMSLRASGWINEGENRRDGKGWSNRGQGRLDLHDDPKIRWSVRFGGNHA